MNFKDPVQRKEYMRTWFSKLTEEQREQRRKRNRKWHKNNKRNRTDNDKLQAKIRRRKKQLTNKIAAFMAYSNGHIHCVCCGITGIHFLTLDHVSNDGKYHRKQLKKQGIIASNFYEYLKRKHYPKSPQLQVLCWNCNEGKRFNHGLCPHIDMTNSL